MKALTCGRLLPLVLPLIALLIAACDETFEPLSSGREALVSVFGYLDPAADTQWIRVMPIRQLKTASPDAFAAQVTLTEVGSGRVITLRDSLLRFTAGGAADDTASAFVHDFWTTERIERGATYKFSATRPDGPTAEAVVNVPKGFVLTISFHESKSPPNQHFARVSGVSYLPFAQQIRFFSDGCGSAVDTFSYRPAHADNEIVDLRPILDTVKRRGRGECGNPVVTRRRLRIAASDSSWPPPQLSPVLGLGATERASNVTNALGFLGGAVTMEVPYNVCTFASQLKWPPGTSSGTPGPKQNYFPEFCGLRFDSLAATSSGRVFETLCGDGPVNAAVVRLTALDDSAKTQLATTGPDGTFEFGGLRPGVRYNLYVHGKLLPSLSQFTNVYSTIDDTVSFAPGEHRTGDLSIERQIPCDQRL